MVQEQEAAKAKFTQQKSQIEADTAVIKAKGEAESIRIRGEALKLTPAFIELQIVEKWDGKAPLVIGGASGGGANMLLPLTDLQKQRAPIKIHEPALNCVSKTDCFIGGTRRAGSDFPARAWIRGNGRARIALSLVDRSAIGAGCVADLGIGEKEEIIGSRRFCVLLPSHNRLAFAAHNLARDFDVRDIAAIGHVKHQIVKHQIKHELLNQPAQCPRARAFFQRLRREFALRVRREFQFHAFHRHELGKLFRQRILRFGENGNHLTLGQSASVVTMGKRPTNSGMKPAFNKSSGSMCDKISSRKA